MSTTTYWVSQALVVLAYILLGIGIRKKQKVDILIFSCIFNVLMAVQFVLLSGTVGIIACIVCLGRNALFIYNEKRGKENPKWSLLVFGAIAIILTAAFYKEPTDIFPCVLTLVGIFSYWYKGTKVARLGTFVISACYIVYAIPIQSWFTIVCEAYIIVNTAIGLWRHDRRQHS